MLNNNLVILTCTVKTKMTHGLKRSETELRLNDYKRAILEWSRLSKRLGFRILVLENSNSIQELCANFSHLQNSNLEFVQLKEDSRSHIEGNSAGEFQMLKEIVEMGIIPREVDLIWKVTGRLFVSNFSQLVPKDCPELIVNRFYNPIHLVDTRIIGFSQKNFKKIFYSNQKFAHEVIPATFRNQSSYSSLEHFITLEVVHSELQGSNVKTMEKVPIFRGYSATSNKLIDGLISRRKKQFANFFRPLIIKFLVGSTP